MVAAGVAAWVAYLPPPDLDPAADVTAAGAWTEMPFSGLAGRSDPSVVWTRKAMIVWGGEATSGVRGDGATFDLATATWTPLPPAPFAPRRGHTAVWTGTTMLVYGGLGQSADCPQVCALGDAVAFDTIAKTWKQLAPAPLAPRTGHSAVWVQNRMVVWGGAAEGGATLADGASYDPATNTWAPLPQAPLAPRVGHRTVATTHRMLVWGGSSETANGVYFADGAVYSPATNSWTPMAAAPGSLAARDNFSSVWTGEQMLVWGGPGRSDGAAYTLESDSWAPIAASPLSGRSAAGAVWTGRDMLIWGGSDSGVRADGALYNPGQDSWSRVAPGPLPARQYHAMVWTGRQLLIWGGEGPSGPLSGQQGSGAKLADGAVLTLRAT